MIIGLWCAVLLLLVLVVFLYASIADRRKDVDGELSHIRSVIYGRRAYEQQHEALREFVETTAEDKANKVWRDAGRRLDQQRTSVYLTSEKIKALQDYLEVELVELSDGTYRIKPDDWD